jgi:phospholipase C
MLGFSGITGIDAASGSQTVSAGLIELSLLQIARSLQVGTLSGIVQKKGHPWPPPPAISVRDLLTSNQFDGQTYRAGQPANYAMNVGPAHEFPDVVDQLCGPGATYRSGGTYPEVNNGGFAASYAAEISESGLAEQSPGDVMKCYTGQAQLPVLTALAQEFVLCDNWYASLPGPTWPNRFFAHASSSGGLDHSPSAEEILQWESVAGFSFQNGTIFDRMNSSKTQWRLYAGDDFPIVAGLKGIQLTDIHDYADFSGDVAQSDYPISYTFIEPSYGNFLSDYKCGTSQHPLDDVTRGEALIKSTYEAIRNSPVWPASLLIITWDEHGGFYDHVPPPNAIAPGDTLLGSSNNRYGFTFEQYGPRVPAVVISPLIPRSLIDHRVYDHASIPATLESCFGLSSMTRRDAKANSLMALVTLATARNDAPTLLPAPAASGVAGCEPVALVRRIATPGLAAVHETTPVTRPFDSIDEENVPGFLHSVLRSELALSPPGDRAAILARFSTIKTRADAALYVSEVQPKVRATRNMLSSKFLGR